MSYEFRSVLHRSSGEMHNAIASEYLSAGGLNGRETMLGFLAEATDAELAADATKEWDLTEHGEFEVDALVRAFTRLRENFDAVFPVKD